MSACTEVRDESGKVVARYWLLPYDPGATDRFYRAQRSEIDALDVGRGHPGAFGKYLTDMGAKA